MWKPWLNVYVFRVMFLPSALHETLENDLSMTELHEVSTMGRKLFEQNVSHTTTYTLKATASKALISMTYLVTLLETLLYFMQPCLCISLK